MFTFQLIGKVTSLSSSKDGKVGYVKLLCDSVDGIDLRDTEVPDIIDLQFPSSLIPAGCGLNTRLQVEGTGAITVTKWVDHKVSPPREKLINNTRMQARTMKLAK